MPLTTLAIRLAVLSALTGGVTLIGLVIMTCVSVAGRALIPFGLGAIPGDYELLQAGVGFAIFCFVPFCQVTAGHATVDVFTSMMGKRPNRIIAAVWEVLFALVLIVIAWRLFEGFAAKLRNGETSMFLQYPIWAVYGACLVPAVLAALVGVWSAWNRIHMIVAPHVERPVEAEAGR